MRFAPLGSSGSSKRLHRGRGRSKNETLGKLRNRLSSRGADLRFEPLEARALLTVGVTISEFMASNASTLADEDGTYPDWIELHNTTAAPVNLAGYILADGSKHWTIPNVSIAADGYMVVFASDKNRSVPGSPLHTNFKLSADGEYLALLNPDGVTVEYQYAPAFPPQQTDISYGIGPGFSTDVLVDTGASAKFLVPTAAPLAGDWKAPAFDDSSWTDVTTGIGYQNVTGGSGSTPIGYWNFDSTTADSSGNNHPVTINGGVYSAETPSQIGSGQSLSLNGTSTQYAVLNPMNVSETAFTVSMWFKTGVTGRGLFSVAKGNLGISGSDRNLYTTGSNITAQLKGGVTAETIVSSGKTYNDNAWHHVAYVLQQGTTPQRIYVDGVQVASGSQSSSIITDQDRIYIGYSPPGLSKYWNGQIDDVAIWSSALSPGQVAALATGVSPLELESYAADIATSVASAMSGVNSSAYLRVPFNVSNLATYDSLTLKVKYDDGFVAYLNGTEIARRNAPASLTWNSTATASHLNGQAVVFEDIDVSAYLGALQLGGNVLSFQGLNISSGNVDFLLSPKLIDVDSTGTAEQYYSIPTPGAANNSSATTDLVSDPQFSVASSIITASTPVTISTATPDALIYYTTNGSVPTQASTLYTGPITVTNTTQIRARAFKFGFQTSNVVSQFYTRMAPDAATFSSNLPVIVVDTYGGVFNGDTFTPVTAHFLKDDGNRTTLGGLQDLTVRAGMRLRGQSSEGFAKHQYAFETWDEANDDQDYSILGMPEESDWIIYGPYTDKALIQNAFIYELSNELGDYAVRTQYVEMFIDSDGTLSSSDYIGVYIFMEKIKQSPDRVDVAPLGPANNAAPDITGGYIFSFDKDDPGVNYKFSTPHGYSFHNVYPDGLSITPAQKTYLTNYMATFETALYGANFADPVTGYAAYIDVDSFINHHLIVELAKNIDGYRISTYYHKDRNGKVAMGPVWDYNLSMGNANYLTGWDPAGFYDPLVDDLSKPYFNRLFQDPNFAQRYIDKWNEYRDSFWTSGRLLDKVDEHVSQIYEASFREFTRWPDLGVYLWPNIYFGQGDPPQNQPSNNHPARTYRDEVQQLRQWLHDRVLWIDSQYLTEPTFNQLGGSIAAGFQLQITGASGGTVYYTTDGSDPRAVGGGISPSAIAYSGNIVLNSNTKVIARLKNDTVTASLNDDWSAPTSGVFVVQAPQLILSEIMYNPAPPGGGVYTNDDFEYVEVQNVGATPLNLGGYKFTQGIDFTFPAVVLAPGASGVVVRNSAAFATRYPGVTPLGVFVGILDNGGEELKLIDNVGVELFSGSYQDSWQPHTDGEGFSLVTTYQSPGGGSLYNSADPSDHWRASVLTQGNPGAADNGLQSHTVVINEILSNTTGPNGDWIELFNTTASNVDLGGWFLSDDSNTLTKYEIAAGTVIPAGGYLVFNETTHFGNAGNPGSHVQFGLSQLGEAVFLSSPGTGGKAGGYREIEDFGAADSGVTLGRYVKSTGDTAFELLTAATQGSANASPILGPVVISEVMYHPTDPVLWMPVGTPRDEFIEIRNTSASSVNLFDPLNPTNTWKLTDGVAFTFPTGQVLTAGAYALIVPIDPAAFRTKYSIPAEVQIYGPYVGNLADDGEKVELSRPGVPEPGGEVPYIRVDRVNYDDNSPWSTFADGVGSSLVRVNPLAYGNDVANWNASHAGGSPGVANGIIDSTPPAEVTNVVATNVAVGTTDPRTNVTWDASSDAESGIAYYNIYRKGSATVVAKASAFSVGASSSLLFVDNTVFQGPAFQYQVAAVNGDGVEGPRSTIGVLRPVAGSDSYKVTEDNSLVTVTAADVAETLIAAGSAWKYLADGSNQGTSWKELGFNDSAWLQGNAQLGYGEADEATIIGFGPDANNKYATTYFRKTYNVTNAGEYTSVKLRLKRDDGASVFFNGVELVRDGLPGVLGDNTIFYNTYSGSAVADDGQVFNDFVIPLSAVVEGLNTIAVEIHQANGTSSDLSFDLILEATRSRTGALSNDSDPFGSALTAVKLTNPSNGQITQFNANGTFTYVPNVNFFGTDTFTYKAVNASNAESLPATVTITVLGVNDAPSSNPGGPYSGSVNVPLQLSGVNSSDPETPSGNLVYEWDYDYVSPTFNVDATGSQPTFTSASAFSPRIIALRTTDPQGLSQITTTTLEIAGPSVSVAGRHVFYNQSDFDGYNPAADAGDDAAIAVDKQPLLPGGTATLANYTSYSRGINGIMIDIAGLAVVPTAADFSFRIGNDNTPGAWSVAPAPLSVSVRPGAGTGGSSRVTIVWADGAISKQWLQVTALTSLGLAQPDVFYFGNAIGESGNSAANAQVNSSDEVAARSNPRTFLNRALATDLNDINRDGYVNATDQIIARSNSTTLATALKLINVPASLQLSAAGLPSASLASVQSASDQEQVLLGLTAPTPLATKAPVAAFPHELTSSHLPPALSRQADDDLWSLESRYELRRDSLSARVPADELLADDIFELLSRDALARRFKAW